MSSAVSHISATISASYPVEREMLKNINMLTLSPTPLGYSVWNLRPMIRLYNVWVIFGIFYIMYFALSL